MMEIRRAGTISPGTENCVSRRIWSEAVASRIAGSSIVLPAVPDLGAMSARQHGD
jgi:hypothetical protein